MKIVSPLSQLREQLDREKYIEEVKQAEIHANQQELIKVQKYFENPFNYYPSEPTDKSASKIGPQLENLNEKLKILRIVNEKFYRNIWSIFGSLKTNIKASEKPVRKKTQNIFALE